MRESRESRGVGGESGVRSSLHCIRNASLSKKFFLFDERKHSYYEALLFAFKAINFHFCCR